MIRGLYSSANSLLVESARTDIISGNLANVGVPGYRRDVATVSGSTRFLDYLSEDGAAGTATVLTTRTHLDLSPGLVRDTGNAYDVALEGPGYLCVKTASGEAYSRGGTLQRSASNLLVTGSGDPVLGSNGPIAINGTDLNIDEHGQVVVDGVTVDRLKLVDVAGTTLHRVGSGLLQADASGAKVTASQTTVVRQGKLEAGNVNTVEEMVNLISALRAFEAGQRALQANDQTLDKAINEVGQVG